MEGIVNKSKLYVNLSLSHGTLKSKALLDFLADVFIDGLLVVLNLKEFSKKSAKVTVHSELFLHAKTTLILTRSRMLQQ